MYNGGIVLLRITVKAVEIDTIRDGFPHLRSYMYVCNIIVLLK
jgi:hypothetical protein